AGSRRMDEIYRSADVFCLASRFEPFGTSFVEAMAYELPCVGPNAWAVPEIIEHKRTGLLFDPDSAASLAEALVRVLSDPTERLEMGKAGRERTLKRFTWPRIADKISAGLESLVPTSVSNATAM
ncbi:MAG: glycosyltransferase family 4 protein, partial [Longimicrobiales bacterium]